jgi:hypothetical protein
MFNFNTRTVTHKKVEFLGSQMVQNLLSVTVLSPALQNMIITKHNFFPLFIALGAIDTPPPPTPSIPDSCTISQPCPIYLQRFPHKFDAVNMNFKFQNFSPVPIC